MGSWDQTAQIMSPIYGAKRANDRTVNPADPAMGYLNQIGPMAQENLGPWQQQGQQAQMQNQEQYNRLVSSPADFYNELRATYSPSEGYKFKQDQMQRAMAGQAAAGGRISTPENQAAQARLTRDLLAEDEMAYMDRVLGLYGTGLQGNELISGRGFGAAGDLANILGTNLTQQAGLAYKQQENENAKRNAWLKALMGLGGAAIGGLAGGPAGAMAGASIGSNLAGGGKSDNQGAGNYQQMGFGLPWAAGGQ